jgi:D-erythronate 2-dehydrogenase
VLPVDDKIRHWHASPRAAVGFLLRAGTLDGGVLGNRRCLTMPGVSATVAEQIEALRRVAGDDVVALIKHVPDERLRSIIADWPQRFDARRAIELGFAAETSFDEIIRVHIEDELGGRIPAVTV